MPNWLSRSPSRPVLFNRVLVGIAALALTACSTWSHPTKGFWVKLDDRAECDRIATATIHGQPWSPGLSNIRRPLDSVDPLTIVFRPVTDAAVTGAMNMVIRIAEIEKLRGPLADSCMQERGWTLEK